MEHLAANGADIRIKRTNGRAITFRVLRTEHAITFNIPSSYPLAYAKKRVEEIIAESIKSDKLNDLKDGGFILLFGEKIPLCVYDADEYSIALCNGKIYLGLVNGRIGYHARRAVTEFYKRRLFEYLKERVPVMENLVGITCKKWKISEIISAWGKCKYTTEELTFSVNLATQPYECIDMVIVHELAHIPYHDHGKEFHAFMDKFVPDNARLKAKMNNL